MRGKGDSSPGSICNFLASTRPRDGLEFRGGCRAKVGVVGVSVGLLGAAWVTGPVCSVV